MDTITQLRSPERVAPSAQAPDSPSRIDAGIQSIRRAQKTGQRFSDFPLRATGGVAKVRRPSLMTLTAGSRAVPAELKKMISEVLRYHTMNTVGAPGESADIQKSIAKTIKDNENILQQMVDATVMVGFVNPKIVENGYIKHKVTNDIRAWPGADEFYELEGDPESPRWVRCDANGVEFDNRTMFLDEIEIEDRSEYFEWCQRSGEREAAAVAPFPEREIESLPPGLHSEEI